MKIGITGQNGFIGRHLFNYLKLQEGVELIAFDKDYFIDKNKLKLFVSSCDTIIHLAAINRHDNPQVIYDTNLNLVDTLISACEVTNSKPHILISSSTQEAKENLYGKSKKEGRERLQKWANQNNAKATGLIIPNVFGPFGRPEYNSVVATFCHKLINKEQPVIIQDGLLKLIYVNKLVMEIFVCIKNKTSGVVEIEHQYECKVSSLLSKLKKIHSQYIENGEFPSMNENFDRDLFNTFRCYIPHDFYPRKFTKHTDPRGSFVEIIRANTSGQYSFSSTVPGITRGNHFHTRKAERFAVIQGKAKIELRKVDSNEIVSYDLDGENPAYVDMPIWYTHNIKNTGDEILLTLFWINEPYDANDPDTFFVNV